MSDVATTAARDAHLLEKLWAAFKDRHTLIGRGLNTGNRGKKSSRTTANNDDIISIHGVSLAKIWKSPRGKFKIVVRVLEGKEHGVQSLCEKFAIARRGDVHALPFS